MTNRVRHLMTGVAFTVTLASAGQAFAAEDRQVTIVLHVENYAHLPPSDRLPAEAEVTRIYATAGIRTVWATGNEHADAPGLHVRVILFSHDIAMRELLAEPVPDSVLGLAAREAGRAYIFTRRIANLALRHGDDFRRVLGRVMAHEVGHLVLPVYSHADQGIMRANVGADSKSARDFTTEQGVAMRSTLLAASRRHAAEITDAAVIGR